MAVRRTLAALLGAALLLVGCTDDPEPRFEPTEPSSPNASESTAEPEAQTPEEFIREWVALDREMQNSGDTEAYLAASAKCGSCRDFADRVEQVYSAGGSINTDGWQIRSINLVQGAKFELQVDSRPTVVIEESEGEPQRFEGGTATYELVLRQADGKWGVSDWYEVAS